MTEADAEDKRTFLQRLNLAKARKGAEKEREEGTRDGAAGLATGWTLEYIYVERDDDDDVQCLESLEEGHEQEEYHTSSSQDSDDDEKDDDQCDSNSDGNGSDSDIQEIFDSDQEPELAMEYLPVETELTEEEEELEDGCEIEQQMDSLDTMFSLTELIFGKPIVETKTQQHPAKERTRRKGYSHPQSQRRTRSKDLVEKIDKPNPKSREPTRKSERLKPKPPPEPKSSSSSAISEAALTRIAEGEAVQTSTSETEPSASAEAATSSSSSPVKTTIKLREMSHSRKKRKGFETRKEKIRHIRRLWRANLSDEERAEFLRRQREQRRQSRQKLKEMLAETMQDEPFALIKKQNEKKRKKILLKIEEKLRKERENQRLRRAAFSEEKKAEIRQRDKERKREFRAARRISGALGDEKNRDVSPSFKIRSGNSELTGIRGVAEQQRLRRAAFSEEKKAEIRRRDRERKRELRAARGLSGALGDKNQAVSPSIKIKTKSEISEVKGGAREHQRLRRATLSEEKKAELRQKDRERKRELRAARRLSWALVNEKKPAVSKVIEVVDLD